MDLDERLLKRIASRLGLTKIQVRARARACVCICVSVCYLTENQFKPYTKEQLVITTLPPLLRTANM